MLGGFRSELECEPQVKKLLVLADGSSIHTVKWIEGLMTSKAWEISLISMNPDSLHASLKGLLDDKDVYHIPPQNISEHGGNYQYLLKLPTIRRLIRKLEPDVISTVYLSSYGLMGALIKGSVKLAHFVVGNDIMIFPKQSGLHRFVTKFALGRSDFVISASETMTAALNDLGYSNEQILTQQYGVSDSVLNFPNSEKEYEFASNRAWVGNSNIPYLLDVLEPFSSSSVALIGQDVLGSENLAAAIRQRIEKSASVQHLGLLPYSENIATVAKSKFIVSLTSSDGASLSVLEGMALGCLPILSDIKPNREWVTHGENGVLLPLDNLSDARARVQEILNWPENKKQKAIQYNKDLVRTKASLTRNMAKVSDSLLRL